ncbi:MAG TPA: hypothetical protein VGF50_14400 [Caulobacteraceae bacterium]
MRTFAIAVAALASAVIWSGAAEAKTPRHAKARPATTAVTRPITTEQASAVAELAKSGLAIQADLNAAIASVSRDQMSRRRGDSSGSASSIECFQVLEGATAELTGDLKELLVATATASRADDQRDVNTAMGFTRLALADVGDSLALVERVTDLRQPSACRGVRLYRDQIARLQAFAHDVTGVTDDLAGAAGAQ